MCHNINIREINSLFSGWCASDQLLAIFKSANVFVLAANHLFFAIYTSKHKMHTRSTGGTFIFTKNTFVWIQFEKKNYSQQLHKWSWIWRLFVQRLFFSQDKLVNIMCTIRYAPTFSLDWFDVLKIYSCPFQFVFIGKIFTCKCTRMILFHLI